MKKFVSTLLVTGMLVGGMASVASAEVQPMYPRGAESSVNVYVNGERLVVDQPAIVKNGRTLVPLRAIFEALGAQIQWEEKTKKITAQRENTVVQLQLNSKVAVVKGKSVSLDVAAESVNYRTMVPVRFVSEALDAHVAWDAGTSSVFVSQYSGQSILSLSDYLATIEEPFYAFGEAAGESDAILDDFLNKKITAEQFRSQHDANLKELETRLAELQAVDVPDDQLSQRYADQTVQLFENLYNFCVLRGTVMGDAGLSRLQELKDDTEQMFQDKDAYEKEFSFLSELSE